jgi:hypothetical protein
MGTTRELIAPAAVTQVNKFSTTNRGSSIWFPSDSPGFGLPTALQISVGKLAGPYFDIM